MITDYFEERGVEYWGAGAKNVSKGWIGIRSVFCNDHSNQLGINLYGKYYSCWLCRRHGKVEDIIMHFERCTYRKAQAIIDNFWEGDFSLSVSQKRRLPPSLRQHEVALPPILYAWPEKYIKYLKGRKFNPYDLIKKYKLMPAHRFGRYGFRIIAPFFIGGKLVTFQGMDITGKKESKYKSASLEDSLVPIDETLYNIDYVRGSKAVIVEGITDAWRIGDGAVALCTNKITDHQILQLLEKGVKEVLVFLDADAQIEMWDLARRLLADFQNVSVAEIKKGDPDELKAVDLIKVQKWLS